MDKTLLFFFCFFCFSIVFSLIINKLFLKAYHDFGKKGSEDEQERWAERPKPLIGGFSFYILFLFSISVYAIIFDNSFFDSKIMGVLLAVSFGFLLGWADDAYGTNPFLKFLGQFLCANILAGTGLVIPIADIEMFDYIFTVFWIIGIMNSINMLDNMDGITTVTSISIIVAMLGICLISLELNIIYSVMLVGVVGALFGFLYFNIPPSKMYMGDTGSQFLGVFLGAISIPILWVHKDPAGGLIQIKQFLLPALVFLMPIIDTTTVFIRRVANKKSPFIGGKDHTTHHLAFLGISERYVMLIFWSLSLFASIIAIVCFWYINDLHIGYSILVFLFCLCLFITMQIIYNRGKRIHDICNKYNVIKLRTIKIKQKKA
jgi:UDP-GlcNAc:undecaprenyl-phosphate GlcNAc-1-phosphate transferase